jgi:hypothetical protein
MFKFLYIFYAVNALHLLFLFLFISIYLFILFLFSEAEYLKCELFNIHFRLTIVVPAVDVLVCSTRGMPSILLY